jgi:hypothetical protein
MDIQLLPILVFMAICLYVVALTINDSNNRKWFFQ